MKKLLTMIMIFAVLAFAGNAMAAWEYGNLQLVAFEAVEGKPLDTTGNEVHYDLGGSLISGAIDTGITLGMLGANSWDEAYVGILGSISTFTDDYGTYQDFYFTSDTADFTTTQAGYGQFVQGLDDLIPSDTSVSTYTEIMNVGPYNTIYQVGGSVGTYAVLLGGGVGASDMGANVNLDFGTNGYVTTTLYTGTMYTVYDLDDLDNLGELYLYAQGDNLWVSDSAPAVVPIPCASILLGSGLLGLIGIRRKKA